MGTWDDDTFEEIPHQQNTLPTELVVEARHLLAEEAEAAFGQLEPGRPRPRLLLMPPPRGWQR